MEVSSYAEGAYQSGYNCDGCGKNKKGERWFCMSCFERGGYDYCFKCASNQGNKSKTLSKCRKFPRTRTLEI